MKSKKKKKTSMSYARKTFLTKKKLNWKKIFLALVLIFTSFLVFITSYYFIRERKEVMKKRESRSLEENDKKIKAEETKHRISLANETELEKLKEKTEKDSDLYSETEENFKRRSSILKIEKKNKEWEEKKEKISEEEAKNEVLEELLLELFEGNREKMIKWIETDNWVLRNIFYYEEERFSSPSHFEALARNSFEYFKENYELSYKSSVSDFSQNFSQKIKEKEKEKSKIILSIFFLSRKDRSTEIDWKKAWEKWKKPKPKNEEEIFEVEETIKKYNIKLIEHFNSFARIGNNIKELEKWVDYYIDIIVIGNYLLKIWVDPFLSSYKLDTCREIANKEIDNCKKIEIKIFSKCTTT